MRWAVLMILWAFYVKAYTQNIDSLLFCHRSAVAPLYNHPEVKYKLSINPIIFLGKTALFFYQKIISDQIGAVCAHEPSCSEYCRQSIEKNGFIRGVLLSGDRLQRCSVFNIMNLRKHDPTLRYGKIYDPVVSLRKKKKGKKT